MRVNVGEFCGFCLWHDIANIYSVVLLVILLGVEICSNLQVHNSALQYLKL